MNFDTFEQLAGQMWARIPENFRDGVNAMIVYADSKSDPLFEGSVLMGECMGDPVTAQVADVPLRSTIHIYHGSFVVLAAREPSFPWEDELWETITHELLHHLEWRAGYDALGDEDDLQMENMARRAGRPFGRDFYRRGARIDDGVYIVDGDLFIEAVIPYKTWSALQQGGLEIEWDGMICHVPPLPSTALRDKVLFVLPEVELAKDKSDGEPRWLPWGEIVVVLRRKRRWF